MQSYYRDCYIITRLAFIRLFGYQHQHTGTHTCLCCQLFLVVLRIRTWLPAVHVRATSDTKGRSLGTGLFIAAVASQQRQRALAAMVCCGGGGGEGREGGTHIYHARTHAHTTRDTHTHIPRTQTRAHREGEGGDGGRHTHIPRTQRQRAPNNGLGVNETGTTA